MLFNVFKKNLRKDLEIHRIGDLEKILHFVPPGYIEAWYSNLRGQTEIRKKNIVTIPPKEIKRIMSLINNSEDVCIIRSPEMTPDIPNHYEIPLDFIEYDGDFGISAYIPKPYIDVPNALTGVVNKTNIQENIKILIRFESSNSKYNVQQILFANNEDADVLYAQYIEAKISFLREGQYVDGFACHINNTQTMVDTFYKHMVSFLPFRDAIMLKSVCNTNTIGADLKQNESTRSSLAKIKLH